MLELVRGDETFLYSLLLLRWKRLVLVAAVNLHQRHSAIIPGVRSKIGQDYFPPYITLNKSLWFHLCLSNIHCGEIQE